MPNGNILVIASYDNSSKPGRVFEVKPIGKDGGEIVWQCDVTALVSGSNCYMNSVSFHPQLNQVLVNIQTSVKTVALIVSGQWW